MERATPYSWFVLGLLTLSYIVAFIDRAVITLMVTPIKADLALSDTEVGMLMGLAFVLLFAGASLPIAWAADRFARPPIIAGGILVWCLATSFCGLARSFGELFAGRMVVGLGEATLSPSANSLISDLFPRAQLGRALGIYNLGATLGSGLALMLGAQLVAMTATGGVDLPLIGRTTSWRAAFIVIGLAGLPLAVLMLMVVEPRRGSPVVAKDRSTPALAAGARAYVALYVSIALVTIATNGIVSWMPTYIERAFGWPISRIGFSFGLCTAGAGLAGVLAGSWACDLLRARGRADGAWSVVTVAVIGFLPLLAIAPMLPSVILTLAALTIGVFGGAMIAVSATTALMLASPPSNRSVVAAGYYVVVNLFGIGLGPPLIAFVRDRFFTEPADIGIAMALVGSVSLGLALIVLLLARPAYAACVARFEPQVAL